MELPPLDEDVGDVLDRLAVASIRLVGAHVGLAEQLGGQRALVRVSEDAGDRVLLEGAAAARAAA